MSSTDQPTIQIRILGKFVVTVDGVERRPKPGRTSTLLALLVVHKDHAISGDQLVRELWGGSPPETATSAFRTYLAEVRHLVGATGIVSAAGKYHLAAGPVSTDIDAVVEEYRTLIEQPTTLSTTQKLGELYGRLTGPYFEGAARVGPVDEMIQLLDEYREAIRNDWQAGQLLIGQSSTLISDVTSAVGEKPDSERLTEMLALARSGEHRALSGLVQEIVQMLKDSGIQPPSSRRFEHDGLGEVVRLRLVRAFQLAAPSLQTSPNSTIDQLAVGFSEGLATADSALGNVSVDGARQLGFDAALSVLAALRWNQAIGERLSTSEVSELLHVSRQALAKRVQSGGLLALPGTRTTWYPAWQFDRTHRDVRRSVREIVAEFRLALDHDVNPFTIATWMNTTNALLDDMSPAAWIASDATPAPVIALAREFAARLAQ